MHCLLSHYLQLSNNWGRSKLPTLRHFLHPSSEAGTERLGLRVGASHPPSLPQTNFLYGMKNGRLCFSHLKTFQDFYMLELPGKTSDQIAIWIGGIWFNAHNTAVPASPPLRSMTGPAILQGWIHFRVVLHIFLHFLQLSAAAFSSHSQHLCSQPARYRQQNMHRNQWPLPHPTHVCFFFLIQKLPLEAFRSKQNVYFPSAGKFCFISLLKTLLAYLPFFFLFLRTSTTFGVLGWQTLMRLLLLPLPFLHLVHPLDKPLACEISAQHEFASLAAALMPHAPHPSMMWETHLWIKSLLSKFF